MEITEKAVIHNRCKDNEGKRVCRLINNGDILHICDFLYFHETWPYCAYIDQDLEYYEDGEIKPYEDCPLWSED